MQRLKASQILADDRTLPTQVFVYLVYDLPFLTSKLERVALQVRISATDHVLPGPNFGKRSILRLLLEKFG